MKICMFTILNDNHMKLFTVFIKSFLYHNPWFDLDFVILDCGLSETSKKIILDFYPNVIFKYPNKKKYNAIPMKRTHEKLRVTYYKLDAFLQHEYDRVISIDMDMLILGDMKEIFECDYPIAACQAYNRSRDQLARTINSGLFVINKRYLEKETYAGIMRVAKLGHSMPDQKTINQYFHSKIKYLDKRYNVEKRMLKTKNYKNLINNVVVWHFIALKPYEITKHIPEHEKGFEEIEKLWWEWYNK